MIHLAVGAAAPTVVTVDWAMLCQEASAEADGLNRGRAQSTEGGGTLHIQVVNRERGAAAVEFGLLLPLLLTLLLGIAEFGYLFNQQISVTQGAREGAREYALHHAEADFDLTAVVQAAAPGVDGVMATSSPGGGSCPSGDTVTVTATKTYTSLTGWFDGILPDDITVTGRGAMRCGG